MQHDHQQARAAALMLVLAEAASMSDAAGPEAKDQRRQHLSSLCTVPKAGFQGDSGLGEKFTAESIPALKPTAPVIRPVCEKLKLVLYSVSLPPRTGKLQV